MKLQKQLSRKVGNKEYPKWVVTIPPEKIKEAGWKEGIDLDVIVKDGKIVLKSVNE
jgi:bifunctional DNA-binding transcriptional regulator/antitoxin component of YhaV-PrlF toxin-antitoxin module